MIRQSKWLWTCSMGGSPIHRCHPNGIADLHVARLSRPLCLVRRTPSALGSGTRTARSATSVNRKNEIAVWPENSPESLRLGAFLCSNVLTAWQDRDGLHCPALGPATV